MVPGLYGNDSAPAEDQTVRDGQLVKKISNYWEWMKNDTTIVGLCPYHWADTNGPSGSETWHCWGAANVSGSCGYPGQMFGLGAHNYPQLIAKMREMGKVVATNAVAATSAVAGCNIFVSPDGNDGHAGTADAPLRSPEAAIALRRQTAATIPCALRFNAGTYHIHSPPLVLGQADSNTTWLGERRQTVLSAGLPLGDECWVATATRGVYSCQLPQMVPSFRVITVGGERKQQARFPDFVPAQPYTGGWMNVNSSRYIGNNSFIVGLHAQSLPISARSSTWRGAKLHIFPTRSWMNLVEVSISMVPTSVESVAGIRHFLVQCPPGGLCTNTSNSGHIGPGNRFFVYGDRTLLSPDEWYHDERTGQLFYHSACATAPTSVAVPRTATVMKIGSGLQSAATCRFSKPIGGRSPGSAVAVLSGPMSLDTCMSHCCGDMRCLAIENNAEKCYLFGRQYEVPSFENQSQSNASIVADVLHRDGLTLSTNNIVLSGMSFADTDFTYYGYQKGWGLTDDASGMPRDAAVVVDAAERVQIVGSQFEQLGGGGVHITGGSRYIDVLGSSFYHLGQSGVVLSGNGTTQPSYCTVQNNTAKHIGEILASAAGIMTSTASFSNFSDNTISYTSRWGIALRGGYMYGSSSAPAESYGNRIERNYLSHLAQCTRDLGGLSFIGQGHAETVVRANCVHDVVGMDVDDKGQILRPFYTWSVYLDNYASSFTIDSNILNGNVLGGVFIHGGNDNTIVNNVMINSSNASMPAGMTSGSQGLLMGDMGPRLANNTVERNIFVSDYSNSHVAMVAFSGHHIHDRDFANLTRGTTFDHNLYYSTGSGAANWGLWTQPTPLGTFKEWRAQGYDVNSLNTNPMFQDASSGDFALQAGSPAIAMGFVPLPPGLDWCGN